MTSEETILEAVLYDLAERAPGDRDALAEALRRLPQKRAEILDFAAEHALSAQLAESPPPPPSVEEAMVRSATGRLAAHLGPPRNPFAQATPADLRRLAEKLRLDLSLLAKLRDRRIRVETIPGVLLDELSQAFDLARTTLLSYFSQSPTLASARSFKSDRPPVAEGRESFADAVRRADLDDDDKARWLALCE